MSLLTDLPAAANIGTSDYILIDTGSQNKKLQISSFYADASHPGLVSTGAQTFAGVKTFSSNEIRISHPITSAGYIQFFDSNGNSSAYLRDRTSSSHRLDFLKRSYNSNDNSLLSTFETYAFPNVDADRTASADYNILTTKSTFLLTSGTAKSVTMANNSKHLCIVVGTNPIRHALFLVNCGSTGGIGVADVYKGSSISYTTATNTFTVTAAGGGATMMFITIEGSLVTG